MHEINEMPRPCAFLSTRYFCLLARKNLGSRAQEDQNISSISSISIYLIKSGNMLPLRQLASFRRFRPGSVELGLEYRSHHSMYSRRIKVRCAA
jgi:hypothetical protein